MCSNGYLKLTDFGVAKSLVNVDHCFATSGTHGYLPPEVYITPHLHGRLADWFAMGVTLHELLTGRRPFESYRLTSFRMPRYKDTLDVNHLQSRPYLSDGAKDFVSNCLQQNPSDRLGAMNDIREIMDHPWLRDVDWNGLYHQTSIPPLTPKKYSLGHEVHMEEVIRCVHEHNNSPSIPDNQQNKFQRFMYNNTPRFNKVGPLSHPVLSVTRRGSPISTLVSVDEESSCLDVSPSVQCD